MKKEVKNCIKYYLENTLMKVDRLYLEDKTISLLKNTDQIEVVLQYEDGTKNLYEEKLFAIHATTKKKSEAIFHINIEVSKGKVSQILLEDFDMKKVDLSSAYVENLAFTSAITPQQNSIMFYISFISTGVIIIICTVILIIKKNYMYEVGKMFYKINIFYFKISKFHCFYIVLIIGNTII